MNEAFVSRLLGTTGDVLWLAFLLVVAVICFLRSSGPRLGGLRLVGTGLVVWVLTEVLSWPVDLLLPLDAIYEAGGALATEAVFASRGLSSVIWSIVAWGLAVAGGLRLVAALAEEAPR